MGKNRIGVLYAIDHDSEQFEDTLQSILSQKDLSEYHIYIGLNEKCKVALNLVKKIKSHFPNQITIVKEKDASLPYILQTLYYRANEEYIVFVPVGEVFVDEQYLHAQVSILTHNKNASAAFCVAKDVSNDNLIPCNIFALRNNDSKVFKSYHFAKYNMVAYSAIMLRNNKLEIPSWYLSCDDAYYPLILMLLGKSSIILNDNVMVEKRTKLQLYPLETCSKNRVEMLHALWFYFQQNHQKYCTKTLKKALINEISFFLMEAENELNVTESYYRVCAKQNNLHGWLCEYIQTYKITADQLQLVGNLLVEWTTIHNRPLVTVICITYAHENFIRQALDSFLMQKTNFKYQIFVGEDHGPDKTADIIREYADKYPNHIIPFLREKNMGAQHNLIDMCQSARTPYIAFCEGDDYWIDEYKLQKQVDFMEEHATLRSCFHDAEIKVEMEQGWFLADQFEHRSKNDQTDVDERLIWPRYMKGFKPKKTYSAKAYIKQGFVHTSSMFFRWDYTLKIPEWYFTHQLGDFTIWLIQLGKGKFGYIPEVMSVYRRHEGGAYYFKDKMHYMLKTRYDWISLLKDLREYFIENYHAYLIDEIQTRINRETNNLFYYVIANMDYQSFRDTLDAVGEESYAVVRWVYNMMHAYKKDANSVPKNVFWYINHVPNGKKKLEQKIDKIKLRYEKKEKFCRTFQYWKNSLIKKDAALWIFSGFRGTAYMDNTMHLFKFVSDNYPQINAVWISTDSTIVDEIVSSGRTAYLASSKEAENVMKKAAVAFIDHYRISDLSHIKGFNHATKIVQLWHGVGNKKAEDIVKKVTLTSGLSSDLFVAKKDSLITKIKKRILLIKEAPNRELYEKYFMYVCPGQEMIDDYSKALHLPKSKFFLCGYPRSEKLFSPDIAIDAQETKNIIFAPTFRWSQFLEGKLVEDLIKSLPLIQKTMEDINGKFFVRFHPHTWRDYNYKLKRVVKCYDRIWLDRSPDVNEDLPKYFAMISDYSSIVYDFLLMDRPLIFYCPDFDSYINTDTGLKYDFESVCPGAHTRTWEETMLAVKEYAATPEKDSADRMRVRDFFYDMTVNDEHNSERIVAEVKKRIKC